MRGGKALIIKSGQIFHKNTLEIDHSIPWLPHTPSYRDAGTHLVKPISFSYYCVTITRQDITKERNTGDEPTGVRVNRTIITGDNRTEA